MSDRSHAHTASLQVKGSTVIAYDAAIPTHAGIQSVVAVRYSVWFPACAGMMVVM
ncbi:MAG: hypothetical protein HEQ39_08800 [Rhizobacter sp.]